MKWSSILRFTVTKATKNLALPLVLIVCHGCATYKPLPLNDHPRPKTKLQDLDRDTKQIAFPALRSHRFDPADGLDMTEIAILAVINNPALKEARQAAGISRIQSMAVHLLPDPQFSLSRDYPNGHPPGTTTAYNAGLSYDLNAILNHGDAVTAADAEQRKTDLELLWQEWQVIAEARVLFSRMVSIDKQLGWLSQNTALLKQHYQVYAEALHSGEVTQETANAALLAWQDAESQLGDLQRNRLEARESLTALLGLASGSKLDLVDNEKLALPEESTLNALLDDLPRRRPDLLALKAGYAAQDARYRQAILAQFPPLNIGFNLARDTGGILTRGFSLSMALPLLTGNRSAIRLEQATRQRLHDEYEHRLLAARNDIAKVLETNRLDEARLKTALAALPVLDKAASNARQALQDGQIDWPGYLSFESQRITKHVEAANLRQALLEGRIALLSLLGTEVSSPHQMRTHR